MEKWYQNSYRRNLVDMHIEDWDKEFLSKFDPKEYIENMKKAQVKTCMIYANNHVGTCFWPTKTGHIHNNMPQGRDWFGETVALAKKEGMDAVGYYTLVFTNYEYATHPEWRIRDAEGKGTRDRVPGLGGRLLNGRYGTLCVNNQEYREYVAGHVKDLVTHYDLEGIFFDMNFWPMVCYCDSCMAKYRAETGKEIPRTVDWDDPEWVAYARARERWLIESALYFTNTVKSLDPEMTVEHNFVGFMGNWMAGYTDMLSEAADFNSGDFYGNMAYQNFVGKMHNAMSKHMPFEFMAARCYPGLWDHTSIKPKDMLYLENCMALANGGAFLFIDAINPDGTMVPEVYEMMGEIFEETKAYEPFMGGRLKANVAVYLSTNSKPDADEKPVDAARMLDHVDLGRRAFQPSNHITASVGATDILKEAHIPYAVLTKKNLKNLDDYEVLVLSSITQLDQEEEETIRKWVMEGGKLYLSTAVALPFAEKLLDAEYTGGTKEDVTYLYPTGPGKFLMEGTTNLTAPVTCLQRQKLLELRADGEVLAKPGLPYTDPADSTRFSSIHSNPPAKSIDGAAMVLRKIGKGKVFYTAVQIEAAGMEYVSQRKMFRNIVEHLIDGKVAFRSNAAPYVDFTLVDQKEHSRLLLSFVNLQHNLPIIPINDVEVDVYLEGREVERVCKLPNLEEVDFVQKDGYVMLGLSTLHVYDAMLIYYK